MDDKASPRIYRVQRFPAPDAQIVARSKELIAQARQLLENASPSTFVGAPRDLAPSAEGTAFRYPQND